MEFEKIEIIRKQGAPSKFRAIINVNNDYNVGVTLNKADMRSLFYSIKNLLEERSELNEPEFAKPKKERKVIQEIEVIKEIEKECSALDVIKFLQTCDDQALQMVMNNVKMKSDESGMVVIIDDEEDDEDNIETVVDFKPTKMQDNAREDHSAIAKKSKVGWWAALLATIGGSITISVLDPSFIDDIRTLLGM